MTGEPAAGEPARQALLPARRAAEVLRHHADDVDRRGRFPHESVTALRDERLLAALIPHELGGGGLTVAEIADVCTVLGRACASTAMIYAMHQIQVACLVAHGEEPAHRFLRRAADGQLLVASGTSEHGHGGDIRSSTAAVEPDGDFVRLRKDVGTMSYGEQADALLVTARRAPDAAATDQVLVLLPRREPAAGEWTQVEVTRPWNALGLRGTASVGATVDARAAAGGVLRTGFAEILAQTMFPVSHVLWSAVWLGIAADALETAGRHLRRAGRGPRAALPRGYAEQVAAFYELDGFCRRQAAAVSIRPGTAAGSAAELRGAVELNSLKVRVSRGVVDIVVGAMSAVGLDAYLLDTDVALGRQLRDALSAPLMIRNDRLMDNVGSSLAVLKTLF
ncbi:acyl-CoA dehydrogenase family protein [Polymorphospora rubra]|uniref:acyl-CoA dehydrogenase family protein n=1 Tax=Polymorphospora rubra TaxID=338584 RepID=UPI0033C3CF51